MSYAFVNHGRWVAHCETDGCSGAERVWPGGQVREKDGRKFGVSRGGVLHCSNCGQTSKVLFPDERKRIDSLLARRPIPERRNWYPPESVEDLIEENKAHGLVST
jgi:hypothetical protein